MKKRTIILTILLLLSMVGNVVLYHVAHQKWSNEDVVTHVDTIPYYKPVPKDTTITHYVTKTVPVRTSDDAGTLMPSDIQAAVLHDTITKTDSVLLNIPITQSTYQSDTYTAYVSGYNAKLDSIFIRQQTTIITKKQRNRKWSVGLGAGYGIDRKGNLTPMIGVSLHYKLLSF